MGRTTLARHIRNAQHSYPSLFEPGQRQTPNELFEDEHRYISKANPRQILIYTDGACSNNGTADARAGWSFVFRPSAYTKTGELTHAGTISGRVEEMGPTCRFYDQTSNRAELRAVIAALQFRDWSTDCNSGWTSIVIATDSQYVAFGATDWIKRWESDDWKLFSRKSDRWQYPKNLDLWKLLLKIIRRLQGLGISVLFWNIPREWNGRADEMAKKAAERKDRWDFSMVKAVGPKGSKRVPYP